MQIDIHGNFEKFVQAQLAAGKYQTAEELFEAMAAAWKARQHDTSDAPLPVMPERIDIAKLAADQGVSPCDDLRELQGSGWPAEDSIEEFETFLRELRGSGAAAERG